MFLFLTNSSLYNRLYDSGSSNPVFCDHLEGWDGVGGSGGRGHVYAYG